MSSFTIDTGHGLITVTDTALKNDQPALLLIHGNSASSKIFRHILESPTITSAWRIITFDLPGHGSSSKAPSPETSYHMRGYAELAVHILQHLNIDEVVVFGWSLGGHIGIEMIELLESPQIYKDSKKIKLFGLMICGTPPALGQEQIVQGFTFPAKDGSIGLAGQRDWTGEETLSFAQNSAAAGKLECLEDWMVDDARNTDGRARMIMARNFSGIGREDGTAKGVDQRRVVQENDVLIGVVNGAEEQYVDLDYLDGIKWKRLWRGKCLRLEGLHHAPFWERPDVFEPVLVEFVRDAVRDRSEA